MKASRITTTLKQSWRNKLPVRLKVKARTRPNLMIKVRRKRKGRKMRMTTATQIDEERGGRWGKRR